MDLIDLTYTKEEIFTFLTTFNIEEINKNDGGMKVPDMFSFYFLLKKLQPEVVIESGVWHGQSTKLIRETLGNVKIISLDPYPIEGYIDENATYYVGDKFKDFKDLDLSSFDMNKVLCFFDDHQNSAQRLIQCIDKNVKHIFFNDNYPINLGSHYTIQHLLYNDTRNVFDIENQYSCSINTFPQIDLSKRDELIKRINRCVIFPNIISTKIYFPDSVHECEGFLNKEDSKVFNLFNHYFNTYNWNTYILL